MNEQDLELIDTLQGDNAELAQLWREHQELETRLDGLAQRAYLTAQEQQEVSRLKKVKLAGRDRIEAILAEHRAG